MTTCLHGRQSKNGIIQCREGRTGVFVYREMCHPFTPDLTLDRVKVKCWQLRSCMMINMSCMDLGLYLCMFMCLGMSAQVHACICVCTCVPVSVLAHLVRCCCHRSVKRVPRWRAPVCRLSVWRWRHRGLSRKLGSEV